MRPTASAARHRFERERPEETPSEPPKAKAATIDGNHIYLQYEWQRIMFVGLYCLFFFQKMLTHPDTLFVRPYYQG